MNRPKLKIEKNKFDKTLEILTFASILTSIILIIIFYSRLPVRIPLHFNWPTLDEKGLGTKDILWASPFICSVIAVGIYKLTKHSWNFNYSAQIDEKNAEYNYRQTTQMLRVLNLLVALLCLWITFISILSGLGNESVLDNYLDTFFFILFCGIPMFYLLKLIINKNQTKK